MDIFGNLNTTMFQVRSNTAVIWPRYEGEKRKRIPLAWKKKAYSGEMSINSQKRIRQAVELLLMSTPTIRLYNSFSQKYFTHRLSYITLSVPDENPILTLKEGHEKLLKPFIRVMNINDKMLTYVWKAEYQERGQIHFHITTPSFIDMNFIRHEWNRIIIKNDLMKDYQKNYNSTSPPSTEIKEVRNIKGMQFYLQKEISKSLQECKEENKKGGKIWDCSLNLKGQKFLNFEMSPAHEKKIYDELLTNTLEEKLCDMCIILKSKRISTYKYLSDAEMKIYKEWIDSLRRPVFIEKTAKVFNKQKEAFYFN